MAGKHKFKKAYQGLDIQKADEVNLLPGILGFIINGEQVVSVPNRNGYVYVRLRDNLSEVTQAYNDNVSTVYGLPVLLKRDETNPSRYRIVGRDLGRYENWGTSSPYLPVHGATHSFDPVSVGGDIVWVFGNQFMPLLVYPSGTTGGGNVLISPSTYYRNNIWHTAGGTGTASFLPYKPTGGNNAKLVLVYLDAFDNPNLLAGNEFSASITGTTRIFQYIPNLPDTSALPLSAVRLVTGTSKIVWDNLYDIRPFIVADGFIPTGTSGHTIQDEGVSLPNRSILNFIGENVWAIDNLGGGRTDIIISGSASGSTGTSISLTDKQIAFGNGSSVIGDAKFLFDSTNDVLSVGRGDTLGDIGGNPKLILQGEGGTYFPGIDLYYYGSSWYPMIRTLSASGTMLNPGSVGSGRDLFYFVANGFITGSSGADIKEGFEFEIATGNPWTMTGAASAVAYMYMQSITGSRSSPTSWMMTMRREKIDFDASINISGTFMTNGFRMGRGAQSGYVLTSDANGVGTWQPSTGTSTSTGTSISLPDKEIGFGNGSSIISSNEFIFDSSTNSLTIGNTTPGNSRFSIYGDDTNYPVSSIWGFGTNNYPIYEMFYSRGTKAAAESILSGDQLFELDFYGYATGSFFGSPTSNFMTGIEICGFASNSWQIVDTDLFRPSYLLIKIGSSGTSGLTNVAKFDTDEINFSGNLNVSGTVRSGTLQLKYYTFSGSNPPTDAQLDAGVGTPASMGKGFTAYWNNNNAGTSVYLLSSDGTNWWYQALTKAT